MNTESNRLKPSIKSLGVSSPQDNCVNSDASEYVPLPIWRQLPAPTINPLQNNSKQDGYQKIKLYIGYVTLIPIRALLSVIILLLLALICAVLMAGADIKQPRKCKQRQNQYIIIMRVCTHEYGWFIHALEYAIISLFILTNTAYICYA